jgi:8-oxo-dGTP diphosphatase
MDGSRVVADPKKPCTPGCRHHVCVDVPRITVAAGALIRDGRILLQQRPAGKDYADLWECPGGKQERDEAIEQTLERELGEELGAVVTIMPTVIYRGTCRTTSNRDVTLSFFRVHVHNRPQPLEGQGLGWFKASEFCALAALNALTPGNMMALDALLKELAR